VPQIGDSVTKKIRCSVKAGEKKKMILQRGKGKGLSWFHRCDKGKNRSLDGETKKHLRGKDRKKHVPTMCGEETGEGSGERGNETAKNPIG